MTQNRNRSGHSTGLYFILDLKTRKADAIEFPDEAAALAFASQMDHLRHELVFAEPEAAAYPHGWEVVNRKFIIAGTRCEEAGR